MAILLALPGLASAQDDGDDTPTPTGGLESLSRDAQRRFEKLANRCIEAYDAGRFDKAEELCSEAATITPHPSTWFVRARIADRTQQCREAVTLYRRVLDTPPAGPAEAKFLEDYRADAERFVAALGDCGARLELTCSVRDLVVVRQGDDGRPVVSGCPDVLAAEGGAQTLRVAARGKDVSTVNVTAIAGKSVTVELDAPRARPESEGRSMVALRCPDLLTPAAVFVDGELVGVCPDTLPVVPGTHLVEALAADGTRAAARIEVPAASSEPIAASLSRLHRVRFACDDPSVKVRLAHALGQVDAPCDELAAATSGLDLAAGRYVLELSDAQGRTLEVPLVIPSDTDGQEVRVTALDDVPVQFEVTCADAGLEPPVYVRLGDHIGQCPLRGTLPMGPYTVEARREGYEPHVVEVQLSHRASRIEVPALEERSLWGAGSITMIAGGVLLVTAVAIDVAGASDLQQLKDLSRGKGLDRCDRACHEDLRSTVDTNIWLTRIFYGVGTVVTATGLGLLLWEVFSPAPGDFGAETAGLRVVPGVSAGEAGVSLRWRF